MTKTPREMGFHMPAEWEPHDAVWLSWPYDPDSFPHLKQAEDVFASFVAEICESERVELLVRDRAMKERASEFLLAKGGELSKIKFHAADYADIWFRDYGPIFLVNRETKKLALAKWIFNAWGDKYDVLLKDNKIPYLVNKQLSLQIFEPGVVLEGGSIEVNGEGTLLTTEQCLLNKNRNPNLTKADLEKYLNDYLGIDKVIWLRTGVEGDDTDGHIDDIARFVAPTRILCAYSEHENDPDSKALQENYEILCRSTGPDGKKFEIIKLPTPGRVATEDGKRLPASYANFYIGTSKVLVPLFGTKNDQKALEIISAQFPERKIIGINALYLVYGFGTFHCMSQQQPAV